MTVSVGLARAEIDAHLISQLYAGTLSTIGIHVVNAMLLIAMLRDYVAVDHMLAWGAFFATVMLLRGGLFWAFSKAKPAVDQMPFWATTMKATSLLTGFVWGLAAWVFMPSASLEHQLFTTMIIIVIASGAASKLYSVLSVFLIFIAPVVTLFVARVAMIGTPLHFAMVASACGLLLFLTYFAMRHRDELVRSLNLGVENKALLERLSQENRTVLSDYSEKEKMEVLLRQKTAVLDAVSKVQGLFIADHDPSQIFDETLDTILDLTSSAFGFIGEVLVDDQGQRYVKAFTVRDMSWDADAHNLFAAQNPNGMEFRSPDTLFSAVLKSGEPVIENHIAADPHRGGIPQNHPAIETFLGVPLYLGEEMVGMVGIANRKTGYDIELLTALDPVISATARMIEGLQSRRERQQTQIEMEAAWEQAKKANLAKTEFLSSMSHELRTPMNAVLGFAQLLQLNPQVPLHPKQADSVEQILKAGNHLLELINEILDLSRIEAGRIKLDLEDIDAKEVVEDCVAYITPLAQRRELILDVQIPSQGRLNIHTDRTRFRQVLLNLLSNAVKYNIDGGAVTLSVHQDAPGKVRFCVSDTGPGIPQDKQEEIFEPFSRLGAETTEIEGTGIGLTISRKLTELMGGQLGFDSVPGHGSKFWIDLPGVLTTHKSAQSEETNNHLPRLPSGVHTVLYVEDNPDNLRLMEHVIAMIENADLISAHTGELGLEMAAIHRPEVVLMDINLPGIDGIETMHRLRSNPATKHIPIIAVSADAMSDDIQRGLAEGFDAYLTKPINISQMIDHLSQAIEGKLGPGIDPHEEN